MKNNIRCAVCEYARQDKKASEYSLKKCGSCESWEECEVCRGCKKRDDCKARKSRKHKQSCERRKHKQSCERRAETICGQQLLKWKAIECTNPDSEYHKALLNVSLSGDMQNRITWSGCPHGERRCGK